MTTNIRQFACFAILLCSAATVVSCRGTPAPPVSCYRQDGSACKFTQPDGRTTDLVSFPDTAANDQSNLLTGDASGTTIGSTNLDSGVDGKDGPSGDAVSVPKLDLGVDGFTGSGDGGPGATGDAGGLGSGGAGGNNGSGAGGSGGALVGGSGVVESGGSGMGGSPGTGGRDGGAPDASGGAVDAPAPSADVRADLTADTAIAPIDARNDATVFLDAPGPDVTDAPNVVDAPGSDTGALPPTDTARIVADAAQGPVDSVLLGQDAGSADRPPPTCPSVGFIHQYGTSADAAPDALGGNTQVGLESTGITSAVAVDNDGNQFIYGTFWGSYNLGSGTVTSAGGSDVLIAKLDPTTGQAVWAKPFGDSSDQIATGVAVSSSGKVGIIGTFTGSMTIGNSITDPLPPAVDFIAAVDASGAGVWAKTVDTLSGALLSIASNPARDEFVVCGFTKGMVNNFGPLNGSGAPTSDNLPDILIAKLDASNGNVIWARQIGGIGTQACAAVTMNNAGDVFATGYYNTIRIAGDAAVPLMPFTMDPGVVLPGFPATVLGVWVAELGSTGTVTKAAGFGGIGKQYPKGIAVDSKGNVAIAGNMKSTLTFTGTPTLISAGGTDGFLAKLDTNLLPIWSTNWGDSNDQEAHGLAFDSLDDIVLVGLINGDATFHHGDPAVPDTILHTNGTTATDSYWAKFSSADGHCVCAANYGDLWADSASSVAISAATTGPQRDVVSIAGFFSGTIDLGSGILPISSSPTVDYLLVLHP